MIEVTVLFLDETFSSTAIGPMEVFRHAGSLWNYLTGIKADPRFHVTTASADGRAVHCEGLSTFSPTRRSQTSARRNLSSSRPLESVWMT